MSSTNKTSINKDERILSLTKQVNTLADIVSISISDITSKFDMLANKLSEKAAISSNLNTAKAVNPLSGNSWKYVDLDSGYRNRTLYPLQSNYVVPFTNTAAGSTIYNSVEPVSTGLPYETLTILSVLYDNPTGGSITVSTPTYNINNFFINSYITSTSGLTPVVTSYTVTTLSNILDYNSQLLPVIGNKIALSRTSPVIPFQSIASYTPTTIVLNPSTIPLSSIPNFYKGMFINISDATLTNIINSNLVRIIQSYDPTTLTFTVSSPFPALTFTPAFAEITQFSYDNVQPLNYNGTKTNQAVCYDVQLLGLAIPNQLLASSYGGITDNYPYLNVHFSNFNDHASNVIYSNNPNSAQTTFKIYMSKQQASPGSFSIYLNQGLTAAETIKLSLNESIQITISTPDGAPLKFAKSDNPPPFPPDPLLQISTLVAVKRTM